jgi:hypothetical protein
LSPWIINAALVADTARLPALMTFGDLTGNHPRKRILISQLGEVQRLSVGLVALLRNALSVTTVLIVVWHWD